MYAIRPLPARASKQSDKAANLLSYTAHFHTLQSSERSQIEAAIRDGYLQAYGAQLSSTDFLPLLLDLKSADSLDAVVGLRPGNLENMLLQKYLDKPVDQKIAEVSQQPVTRDDVVEIGNLVSVKRGGSQIVFILLAAVLESAGYQWMVFTGTPTVKKLINRLGYDPIILNEANPATLGTAASHWGRYYQTCPKVMLVNISTAMTVVRNQRVIFELLKTHQRSITSLANQLRDYRRLSRKHHAQ